MDWWLGSAEKDNKTTIQEQWDQPPVMTLVPLEHYVLEQVLNDNTDCYFNGKVSVLSPYTRKQHGILERSNRYVQRTHTTQSWCTIVIMYMIVLWLMSFFSSYILYETEFQLSHLCADTCIKCTEHQIYSILIYTSHRIRQQKSISFHGISQEFGLKLKRKNPLSQTPPLFLVRTLQEQKGGKTS